ncbi:CBASS oligonucleotide cyclase [Peribacillus sp. SCS-37]|uniref:CBASS oligonucleotide cyclase n=1 Tax=Paraperibacillus esterisolvens TaxID=3115296 RepID=UPI003905B06E
MGGSGGGFGNIGKTLNELMKENNSSQEEASFNREVNAYLSSLLTNLNDRDVDKVNDHLATLEEALGEKVEGYLELKFGGSVSKHTYANGLSDIDMLVQLNDSSLADLKPKEVLSYFKNTIHDKLPQTEVSVGKLAVTVKFPDGYEIQLLPSISTETGMRIAKVDSNEWSNVIKPKQFAEKLTEVNRENIGRVVPTIKIFKVMNSQLPKQLQLSGYHIESLAIDAFKGGKVEKKTYRGMLHHFCEHAQKAVLGPIKDSTGQSIHVDEYLGSSDSVIRKQVSKAIERLSNKMNRADAQKSLEQWINLID